jgi:hypothetical protein
VLDDAGTAGGREVACCPEGAERGGGAAELSVCVAIWFFVPEAAAPAILLFGGGGGGTMGGGGGEMGRRCESVILQLRVSKDKWFYELYLYSLPKLEASLSFLHNNSEVPDTDATHTVWASRFIRRCRLKTCSHLVLHSVRRFESPVRSLLPQHPMMLSGQPPTFRRQISLCRSLLDLWNPSQLKFSVP